MFEKFFPYYLSIGMTFTQFWEEDSLLVKAFRKAEELSRQKKSEEMWLQGFYNFNAFSTALSNLNFGKKKKKPNKYMENPIRLLPLTELEKEAKAEEERKKVIAYFNNLAKKWETEKQ